MQLTEQILYIHILSSVNPFILGPMSSGTDPGLHTAGICEGKPFALMSPQTCQFDTVKQGMAGNWVGFIQNVPSDIAIKVERLNKDMSKNLIVIICVIIIFSQPS